MPKAKKYSHKRRHRRHNRTKRGGMSEEGKNGKIMPYIPMYNKNTGKPVDTGTVQFYNPKTFLPPPPPIDTRTAAQVFAEPNPEEKKRLKSEAEIEELRKKREKADREVSELMRKLESTKPAPVVEEEVEECIGDSCIVSGGRKSRRKRRKGRKSRKHRKH